jgi:hemerythrin-like domain-containing protein
MATFDLEAMRRVHEVLRDDLQKLQGEIQSAARTGIVDLCDQLGRVRDHIASHFRLEEQDGYMDVVARRQPGLNRAIRHLGDEHAGLLEALDVLIAEASRATTVDDRLCKRISAWLESVRSHEDRENHLIEDAFNVDIGPSD